MAINHLITVAMVAGAERWLGMAMSGKLPSMPAVAVDGFLLDRHWIFRRAKQVLASLAQYEENGESPHANAHASKKYECSPLPMV